MAFHRRVNPTTLFPRIAATALCVFGIGSLAAKDAFAPRSLAIR